MSWPQLVLSGLLVFASFTGGLLAVFLGQFLAFYREERQDIDELYVLIQTVSEIDSEDTPFSTDSEDVNELVSELKELHLRTRWAIDSETEHLVQNLIKSLQTLQKSQRRIENDQNNFNAFSENPPSPREDRERAIKYANEATTEIERRFSRIPFKKFLRRYLGFFD